MVNNLEEVFFSFKGQEHYYRPEGVICINSVLDLERTKIVTPFFHYLDQFDHVN